MTEVLSIIYLVTVNLTMIMKILKVIKEAAEKFKDGTGEEKQVWVTVKLQTMFPKLSENEIYNWIKSVLYLARLVGIKI